jgi:3alpha(or 20beta)-hydroxysteroid dehydrogenase
MHGRLAGKVALISGGAQGIGEATARLFAAEQAKVVLADINRATGEKLTQELGVTTVFVRTDVTSAYDWAAAIATATTHFGGIDILVNNAGSAAGAHPMVEEDEASHRRLLDLNLTGSWRGMRAVVPAMIARGGGSIVNISSIDGLVGVHGMSTYVATKFAVTGLTRSLALEVGCHGIRVNSVHPGITATPLVAAVPAAARARLDHAIARQPIKRIGRPEEVAYAVLFFASGESSYCTGTSLVVDGGHIAGPYREPLDAAE